MKLVVEIRMSNAAFAGAGREEAARILRVLADRVELGRRPGALLDINGNTVGTARLEPEP